MKSTIKLISSVLFIFILFNCKENPEAQELANKLEKFEALKEQAMEVHDEVMPKMGELMEYSEKMQVRVNDSSASNIYAETKSKLDGAHDGMMEWMRDYSSKFPYGDPLPNNLEDLNSKITLLKEEVAEIKNLKQETNEVIENSKKLLTDSSETRED